MRALLWGSLVIGVIIFFKETAWLGKGDLAIIFMGLAIAIILQAGYLLSKK